MLEDLGQTELLILFAAVAGAAFLVGRATGGGGSPEDRAERRMRERQEAERLFSGLPPEVQQDVDARLANGKTIEAVKIVRENSGAGLKEAKQAVDYRRASMGAV